MKTLKFKSFRDIAKIEKLGAVIEFEPQEESIDPREQFDNEDMANQIIEDYNSGNAAAWFCARVIVKYRGLVATDYLGACSYKSFREFTGEKDGYYVDMIRTCVAEINKEIENANFHTLKSWAIRKAKNLLAPYGLYVVSTLSVHPP